jgi:hypothetical protein
MRDAKADRRLTCINVCAFAIAFLEEAGWERNGSGLSHIGAPRHVVGLDWILVSTRQDQRLRWSR